MKRLAAAALAVVAVVAAAGCTQSNSPAAPIAGIDKAKDVQQQSNTQSSQLEQKIDDLQP